MENVLQECQKRQQKMVDFFADATTSEERYQKVIQLGKNLTPVEEAYKIQANIVPGCQSVMYLQAWKEADKVYFKASSEALISAGLAALLIEVYSGLSPEEILTCPPSYLETLQLSSSLSPNRANGLYNIHLKMKQEALRLML